MNKGVPTEMAALLELLRSQMHEKDTQIAVVNRDQERKDQRISGLELELAAKSSQKPKTATKARRRNNAFFLFLLGDVAMAHETKRKTQ